jgi:uncharacterized membrane protein
VRLLAASRRETLRRLAVTLLGLSAESLDAVLGAACQMRRLEALADAGLTPTRSQRAMSGRASAS